MPPLCIRMPWVVLCWRSRIGEGVRFSPCRISLSWSYGQLHIADVKGGAIFDRWTQASRRRKRSGSGPDWLQFKYHNVFSGLCQNLKVGGGMVHGDSALSLVRQEHADVNTLAGASNFKQCKTGNVFLSECTHSCCLGGRWLTSPVFQSLTSHHSAEEVTLMQRLFVDLNFITLRIARAFNHIPGLRACPLGAILFLLIVPPITQHSGCT